MSAGYRQRGDFVWLPASGVWVRGSDVFAIWIEYGNDRARVMVQAKDSAWIAAGCPDADAAGRSAERLALLCGTRRS